MFRFPHIPLSEELIDKSFRQGAKAAKIERGKGKRQSREDRYLNGEIERVKIAGSIMSGDLNAIVEHFPSFDQLTSFHQSLFKAQISLDRYRKSIARVQGVGKTINEHKSRTISQLKKKRETEASKVFMGKSSSMIKKIDGELKWLVEAKKTILKFPIVKEDLTIVIAGYPNVGKSTFLKTLTGSNVKVAPYPFTTQNLLIGYCKKRYIEYQLVDTPGLLDRPLEDRNTIERQAVSALENLAHIILFIFDESQEPDGQVNLYREIKKQFKTPVIKAINLKESGQTYSIDGRIRKGALEFNALNEKDCIRLFGRCVEKLNEIDY